MSKQSLHDILYFNSVIARFAYLTIMHDFIKYIYFLCWHWSIFDYRLPRIQIKNTKINSSTNLSTSWRHQSCRRTGHLPNRLPPSSTPLRGRARNLQCWPSRCESQGSCGWSSQRGRWLPRSTTAGTWTSRGSDSCTGSGACWKHTSQLAQYTSTAGRQHQLEVKNTTSPENNCHLRHHHL